MNTNKFTVNNIEYTMNPETGYCTKTVVYPVEGGKTHRQSIRIGKSEFTKAMQEYDDQVDAKMREAIERLVQEEEDAEVAAIQKEMSRKSAKKANKAPRKKKVQTGGMEFTEDGMSLILTEKQVEFIRLLPGTYFWKNGVNSDMYIDTLCDELEGKMAPMTIGAMVSTLREKHLLEVEGGKNNNKKAKFFRFTDIGKAVVAKVLGL